jgi:hypothetical protein
VPIFSVITLAPLGSYIFSLIAGFPIGHVTIGYTFVQFALANGYSFRLIKNKSQLTTCISLGILAGT